MGYCEDHDKVYAGGECPVCSGDETDGSGASSNAETSSQSKADTDPEDGTADVEQVVNDRLDEALGESVDAEAGSGDVVVGDQTKSVDKREHVDIDNSTQQVDQSEVHHDERTEVKDSVVNRSNVGTDEGENASVEDSTLNRSNVGGGKEATDEGRAGKSSTGSATSSAQDAGRERKSGTNSEASSPKGGTDSKSSSSHTPRTCPGCDNPVDPDDAFCMECGTELQ
jgi:hypothetical protein